MKDIDPSGAIGINAKFEAGQSTKWYIEVQRACADLIEAGVTTQNSQLIERGLLVLHWGLQKEADDGSFPGTGEPFHSTSLFVDGAARSLLLLKQQGDSRYATTITDDSAKLEKAAQWLMRPDIEGPGLKANLPFTHRYYILAAALGEVSALTGDTAMAQRSKEYAEAGLPKQQSDGINPEKNGYDVSYQMVGIMHAEHYFTTLDCDQNKEMCDGLRHMISNGLSWERAHQQGDGSIDIGLSTRIEPGAVGRGGKQKGVNYKEVMEAFVYGATITGEKENQDAAQQIARYKRWIH